MQKNEPLAAFARGLHQDVFVDLNGLDDLADLLLSNLSPTETEAFRRWLAKALRTLTPSELKGMLNRSNSSIGFSSKGAYELLRGAADRLGIP
jgi:hypothetical protein